MSACLRKAALWLGGCLLVNVSVAATVEVPITLSHPFIEAVLREQAFSGPGASVRINDDGSGCQFLELKDPQVRRTGSRLQLRAAASARAGRLVGGRCLLALNWQGSVELDQQPLVADDGRGILLQTLSWRAVRADGSTDRVTTTIGRWLEQFLPGNLRRTRIRLDQPLDELQAFLALVLAPQQVDGASTLLEGIELTSVAAGEDGATVKLAVESASVTPLARGVEPELSAAELEALELRLDDVDAFVTNTIRGLTGAAATPDLDALLEVLLALRMELIEILRARRSGPEDPARRLFVNAWNGLSPVLRVLAEQQAGSENALRFLSFLSAGDALRALDQLGPEAGIEISSDGLRRLARILVPDDPADPLERSDGVDPELRRAFGFGEPLPPPQLPIEASWLDWLVPKAYASSALDPAVISRLNTWVPGSRDMNTYLPMVRDVLRHVVAEQLKARRLEASYHAVYRVLVFAAAWQESCWRQFVAENNKRVPMRSGTGDLGMMQINPKVWRGFYDLQGLRWDIVYNARAGADILEHHLLNYAIAKAEHQQSGGTDNLARAAYAAYNGGPRQYDRYRRADASPRDRKVDGLFFDKYREVKAGRELAVLSCYSG